MKIAFIRIEKKCLTCGKNFMPKTNASKYCNRKCYEKRREGKEDFKHGEIWVLDMENWQWHLEIRD